MYDLANHFLLKQKLFYSNVAFTSALSIGHSTNSSPVLSVAPLSGYVALGLAL